MSSCVLDSIAATYPPATVPCHQCGIPLTLEDAYSECPTCGDRFCKRCSRCSCDDAIAKVMPYACA